MTLPRILLFFCLQAVPLLACSQRQNLKFEHYGQWMSMPKPDQVKNRSLDFCSIP